MKSEGLAKHFAIAFALALGLYFASFATIQYFRERHGPWVLLFEAGRGEAPSVSVRHSGFQITGVRFLFPGADWSGSNLSQTIAFDQPITNIPFGQVAFIDNTFQPGTLTMNLFGHEIELLPRTLVIDKTEVAWTPETNIVLPAVSKPAPPVP